MDDDMTFGASVWGASGPATPVKSESEPGETDFAPAAASAPDDSFDDFDDFGPTETAAGGTEAVDDDDFGDFGDFGDAATTEEVPPADFSEAGPSPLSLGGMIIVGGSVLIGGSGCADAVRAF